MLLLFAEYIILAALVVIFSLYLSKYVDALDKKTNLSGAFIGGVMLAAVTSLPELFTSITAILGIGMDNPNPQLVQGNVFGSNIFNLTIIGICVFMSPKNFSVAKISKTHFGTVLFTLAMFIACLIGMYIPSTWLVPLGFTNVNIITIVIIILYILNLKLVNGDDDCENNEEDNLDLTVKQIAVRFILFAIGLVIVSILLTQVTDKIGTALNLGKTVAGAVFLGVATSLPELTSSINLVRLKNYNASIGNVVGSNLFNFTILCFGDLIYSGNIYMQDNGSITLILFGVISSLIAMFTIKFQKKKMFATILALLIIVSYVCSIAFSM